MIIEVLAWLFKLFSQSDKENPEFWCHPVKYQNQSRAKIRGSRCPATLGDNDKDSNRIFARTLKRRTTYAPWLQKSTRRKTPELGML